MVGIAVWHDLWASGPAARRVIEGNRKRDTLPEIAMRRPPCARGLRYRIAGRPLADCSSMRNLAFRASWYSLTVPTGMGSRSAARAAKEPRVLERQDRTESCAGHSDGHGAAGDRMDRTSHLGAPAAG